MTTVLSGKEAAATLKEQNAQAAAKLKARGINPRLEMIRVGDNPDDLYYQQSLERLCEKCGIESVVTPVSADASQEELEKAISAASNNPAVHGILLFCPLPKAFDEKAARAQIAPHKDLDCLTELGAARAFAGIEQSSPCTPAAVMELLRYYNIPLQGKKAVVLGRSLVVGKPLAMLLLGANATVTICHSKTENLAAVCREADVLLVAIGKAKFVNADFVHPNQIVIDVGINDDPDNPGKICGDVDFASVDGKCAAISPVPGGVGSLTSAILCRNLLRAAEND